MTGVVVQNVCTCELWLHTMTMFIRLCNRRRIIPKIWNRDVRTCISSVIAIYTSSRLQSRSRTLLNTVTRSVYLAPKSPRCLKASSSSSRKIMNAGSILNQRDAHVLELNLLDVFFALYVMPYEHMLMSRRAVFFHAMTLSITWSLFPRLPHRLLRPLHLERARN